MQTRSGFTSMNSVQAILPLRSQGQIQPWPTLRYAALLRTSLNRRLPRPKLLRRYLNCYKNRQLCRVLLTDKPTSVCHTVCCSDLLTQFLFLKDIHDGVVDKVGKTT
jgi:hypothetical protein